MTWEEACLVLGVKPTASREEIKSQYIYRANLLHPDKTQGQVETIRRKAEEELKLINVAYSFLRNPKNKPLYKPDDIGPGRSWREGYWEKDRKTRHNFSLPVRQWVAWVGVALLSLFLTLRGPSFGVSPITWFMNLDFNFCSILSLAILVRFGLSWLSVNPRNLIVRLLDDISGPILSPLRRIVPPLAKFDITPIVAACTLMTIVVVFNQILLWLYVRLLPGI